MALLCPFCKTPLNDGATACAACGATQVDTGAGCFFILIGGLIGAWAAFMAYAHAYAAAAIFGVPAALLIWGGTKKWNDTKWVKRAG